jgi:hypothetical protein
MLRLVLLSVGAAHFFVSGAQAHGVHADCRVGDSRMGVVPHWHPGGYGQAQPCGGRRGHGPGYGGGYYQPPPPYYGPEYQGGGYYQPTPPIIGPGYRRW